MSAVRHFLRIAVPSLPDRLCTGDEEDIVKIESIEVSPDPPKAGEDLTVKVKATTSEAIEV
jgi:hypothetical protein